MCTEITCTIHNNYYCKTVDDYFIFNSLMDGNASAWAVSIMIQFTQLDAKWELLRFYIMPINTCALFRIWRAVHITD